MNNTPDAISSCFAEICLAMNSHHIPRESRRTAASINPSVRLSQTERKTRWDERYSDRDTEDIVRKTSDTEEDSDRETGDKRRRKTDREEDDSDI